MSSKRKLMLSAVVAVGVATAMAGVVAWNGAAFGAGKWWIVLTEKGAREHAARQEAAWMVAWHRNAEVAARSIRSPGLVPRESIQGRDWLDPHLQLVSATDGSGLVVTWARARQELWPGMADALHGNAGVVVGMVVGAPDGTVVFIAPGRKSVGVPTVGPVPDGGALAVAAAP